MTDTVDRDVLEAGRRDVAADTFESFDFSPHSVVDTSGWETATPGSEWSRTVFLDDPENPGGDSLSASFTLRFVDDGSFELAEAFCLLDNHEVGHLPDRSAAPGR